MTHCKPLAEREPPQLRRAPRDAKPGRTTTLAAQLQGSALEEQDLARHRGRGSDVLRYWLAALRLEEALQARPMARAPVSGEVVARLDQPTPGQDYFKLPLGAALGDLLEKQTQLTRAFDAELGAFFETWLYGRYRSGEDEADAAHLLCFPVIHLPRGELCGVLRCAVGLRFGSDGSKAFRAPTRTERQRGSYPPAPNEARLTRAKPAEGEWPFFVDARLLHQTLGVSTESIDAFFEALRARATVTERYMLALVTMMLEGVANGDEHEPRAALLSEAAERESCSLEAWLERLSAVVRRLLESRSSRGRAYAVAIVIDGGRAKTTWHLQRELEALLEGERGPWQLDSALGAYLTSLPLSAGQMPQRALFPGPPLSGSQRAAADTFWGSSLSAVQGPPGTGKTRLILHLCAEALVRQAEALLGGTRVELLLVTSSNNRAVDNVLQPLASGEGLPLALRAGSRHACEHQLLPELGRALSWLKRAEGEPEGERRERLALAKAQFLDMRDAIERVLAPRRRALERAQMRSSIERELARCQTEVGDPEGSAVSPGLAKAALHALPPLVKRLEALSALCEAAPTVGAVQALEAHYKRTAKRYLPALREALKRALLSLELPLPPTLPTPVDASHQLDLWEQAAELGLERLAELRRELELIISGGERELRARQLRAQLDALAPVAAQAEEVTEAPEDEARALFARASAVREAWASAHAEKLTSAVTAARRSVEQERSLRALFRSDPTSARLVCQLFGVWGSTLLSLGNCFPPDLGGTARLVIDEAGQCHPAHAVSGLLRVQHALVIGDVHQLSPVVELGADDEARLVRSCRLATSPAQLGPYRVHANAISSSQSVAELAVEKRGNLTDHFRCQADIIALSDALCGYGLTVHTPRADRSECAPYLRRPLALVDVQGEQARLAGSWHNEREAQQVLALVESLLGGRIQPEEIAVITPYRGQLERLRRGLSQRGIALEDSAELTEVLVGERSRSGVALGTVHRFQGGERSIVLFSSVVTHPGSLSFLNERPNLLNVAISRAQHHFVCVGHAALLAQGRRSHLLVAGVPRLAPAAYGGAAALGAAADGFVLP